MDSPKLKSAMDFQYLRQLIKTYKDDDFINASMKMQEAVFALDRSEIIHLINEISVIPEDIAHDSSEEKLYSKTSDILFAKALECMNLEVGVLRERADSADIIARSKYHGYSLVGDAKVFRLSRTAKNAKDFKVDSMAKWRGNNDFSVLVCPYFQYPTKTSQIYKEALNGNVMLFSWEWLYVMLKENIRETAAKSLKDVWNQSEIIGANVTIPEQKNCFLTEQDNNLRGIIGITKEKSDSYFSDAKTILCGRGRNEISYYKDEIERVRQLGRDEAINELLSRMKLDSKIRTIQNFIKKISNGH